MEKRDAIFLLLVLGGAGYAAYTNWDTIVDTLSLRELHPGRIKAVELAKKSRNFAYGVTNWQQLQSRAARGEIEITEDAWQAYPIQGEEYRVVVRWTEDDVAVAHSFKVDVGRRTTVHEGELGAAASPR